MTRREQRAQLRPAWQATLGHGAGSLAEGPRAQRPVRGRRVQAEVARAADAVGGGRLTTSPRPGFEAIVVFTGRNWTGQAGCIRLGQRGDLAGGLVNNVHSYRWVTTATCNRYKTALAARRG